MDDQQLLVAWRGGDEDAGEVLFERFYDALSRFFRSKAGDGAPDLIQRTFLGCLEGQERFAGIVNFRGYLFGIARNVLYNFYRARTRSGEEIAIRPSSAAARHAAIGIPRRFIAWAIVNEVIRRVCGLKARAKVPLRRRLQLEGFS